MNVVPKCINCKGEHIVYKCPLQNIHKTSTRKVPEKSQQSWAQVAKESSISQNKQSRASGRSSGQPNQSHSAGVLSDADKAILLSSIAKGVAMAVARTQFGIQLIDEELQAIENNILNNIKPSASVNVFPNKDHHETPTIVLDEDSEVRKEVQSASRVQSRTEGRLGVSSERSRGERSSVARPVAPKKTPEGTVKECPKCGKSFKAKGYTTHVNACKVSVSDSSSSMSVVKQPSISSMFASKAEINPSSQC